MTRPDTVVIEEVPAVEAGDLVEHLRPIYAEVYGEPPYSQTEEDTAEFVTRYGQQATRPGFRLVVARDSGQVVGFAYTITLPAGRWWNGAVEEPPANLVAVDKVAVVELELLAPYRGHGLGRALMNAVLAGRTEPYATLLAEPDAPARRIYAHWGWQQVGTVQSQPQWGADDALVLPLNAE